MKPILILAMNDKAEPLAQAIGKVFGENFAMALPNHEAAWAAAIEHEISMDTIFKRIQAAMPQEKEYSMIVTEFRWRRGFWEQDLWDQLNAWEGA